MHFLYLLAALALATPPEPAEQEAPPDEAGDADAAGAPVLTREMLQKIPTGRRYRSAVRSGLDPVRAVDLRSVPTLSVAYRLTASQPIHRSGGETNDSERPWRAVRDPVGVLPVPRSLPGALGLLPGAVPRGDAVRVSGGDPVVYLDGARLGRW